VAHLPPVIRDAVGEVVKNVKAPLPLVASAALAAVSLACQGLIDVRRSAKLVGPTGLFFMTVARSGERKSSVDYLFMKPFFEKQEEAEQSDAIRAETYALDYKLWQKQLRRLIAQHADPTSRGKEFEAAQQLLYKKEPPRPRLNRLIFRDATSEAITQHYLDAGPSAGLISNEGGSVLEGHAIRNLSQLNEIWDGQGIRVDRVGRPRVHISNARLTISLQVQPSVFEIYMKKRGENSRGGGFLARTLYCFPESTIGTRRLEISAEPSWSHLPKFQQIVRHMLTRGNEGVQRIEKGFQPDAQEAWRNFHDAVETELGEKRRYSDIFDFGSKIADNAARLAALFHFFQDETGEISLASTQGAIEISKWYLAQFKRRFGVIPQTSQEEKDAATVDKWLRSHKQLLHYEEAPQLAVEKQSETTVLNLESSRIWQPTPYNFPSGAAYSGTASALMPTKANTFDPAHVRDVASETSSRGSEYYLKTTLMNRIVKEVRVRSRLEPALSVLEQDGRIFQRLHNGKRCIFLSRGHYEFASKPYEAKIDMNSDFEPSLDVSSF